MVTLHLPAGSTAQLDGVALKFAADGAAALPWAAELAIEGRLAAGGA